MSTEHTTFSKDHTQIKLYIIDVYTYIGMSVLRRWPPLATPIAIVDNIDWRTYVPKPTTKSVLSLPNDLESRIQAAAREGGIVKSFLSLSPDTDAETQAFLLTGRTDIHWSAVSALPRTVLIRQALEWGRMINHVTDSEIAFITHDHTSPLYQAALSFQEAPVWMTAEAFFFRTAASEEEAS